MWSAVSRIACFTASHCRRVAYRSSVFYEANFVRTGTHRAEIINDAVLHARQQRSLIITGKGALGDTLTTPQGAVIRVKINFGDRTAKQSTKRQAELSSGDDVEEEIAGVMRQTDFVDDFADHIIGDVSLPGDYLGVFQCAGRRRRRRRRRAVRACAVERRQLFREGVAEDVDQSGGESGEDDVERHGQEHGVGGRVLRRRSAINRGVARFRAASRATSRLPGGCRHNRPGTGARHAPNFPHNEYVDDQNDERNDEKNDHLGGP